MLEADRALRRIRDARKFCQEKKKGSLSEEEREDIEDFEDNIEKLVQNMCDYTQTVFRDNSKNYRKTQLMKEMEGADFRTYCEDIEKSRKNAHNQLITQVKLVDQICEEYGVEPIYGMLPKKYQKDVSGLMGDENRKIDGVVQARHDVADWAWDVTLQSTVGLYIDIGELNYTENLEDMQRISEEYDKRFGSAKRAASKMKEVTDPDL